MGAHLAPERIRVRLDVPSCDGGPRSSRCSLRRCCRGRGGPGRVDQTCALTLTKFDPATVNVAYPDDSAQYYSGAYQLAPGTRIRIHGQFPHARYMSFNVYDAAQRPLDGLSDVVIRPDAGNGNPFAFGAERTFAKRDYTVFIDTGPRPDKRAPNTLYTGPARTARRTRRARSSTGSTSRTRAATTPAASGCRP